MLECDRGWRGFYVLEVSMENKTLVGHAIYLHSHLGHAGYQPPTDIRLVSVDKRHICI